MGVRKGRGSGAARRGKPSGTRSAAPEASGTWAAALAARSPGERRYWLVKSEPMVFSFDDLEAGPGRTTHWDGVRNFTARNVLRDGMKRGDGVLFYHSMATPPAIVGTCDVVREGHPGSVGSRPEARELRPAVRSIGADLVRGGHPGGGALSTRRVAPRDPEAAGACPDGAPADRPVVGHPGHARRMAGDPYHGRTSTIALRRCPVEAAAQPCVF